MDTGQTCGATHGMVAYCLNFFQRLLPHTRLYAEREIFLWRNQSQHVGWYSYCSILLKNGYLTNAIMLNVILLWRNQWCCFFHKHYYKAN